MEITLWAISALVLPLLGSTADYANVTADDYEPEWADWSIPRPSMTGMPQPTPTHQPSLALKYDPAGQDRNCDDFSTWQEAQAFFLATQNDSHRLDTDGNGIACEDLAGAPEAEVVEVEVIVTSTPAPTPTSEPTMTSILHTPTPQPTTTPSDPTGMWRGLTVADEVRCSSYDADDYPYSQSVERQIVADMGGLIYGPYTGTWFATTGDTDIEHIVARSEAHDSGLCDNDDMIRRRFASDLLNLTLASPSVNRDRKSGKDAAEWLPDLNQCWFADRVVQVRLKYHLSIDRREADTLESVLSGCSSTEMVIVPAPSPSPTPGPAPDIDALAMWDDNGNGRITCAEARRHGIAPVRRGHPAYPYMRDTDGDGVVCE